MPSAQELLQGSAGSAAAAVPFSRPNTPKPQAVKIGFVGLGNMGYLMARNLANHRIPHHDTIPSLLVWNRTSAKCEQLLAEVGPTKIQIARDLTQIANECDVIITNLSNDVVVKDIFTKLAAVLDASPPIKQKVFVETSTIYPAFAGELDSLITRPHTHLITCPVFGAPPAADRRELILVMSGDYRAKKEVAYLLVPAIGKKVIDVGGNVEKAPTFKLIGNSLILGSLEVLAESFTLAEKSGVGAASVLDLIRDLLPAPILVNYGDKMVHDKFDGTTGFAIDNGIKDASHIRKLTAYYNSPMPTIDTAHQHLITARALNATARARGHASRDTLDWSSIVAATRVSAGLDGFDSNKHTSVVQED